MPVSGAWRLSYSLQSRVDSEEINQAHLFFNGVALFETSHYTYSETGVVSSTGGCVVTVEASAGDQIEIRIPFEMDGDYFNILYCAEYIPKM